MQKIETLDDGGTTSRIQIAASLYEIAGRADFSALEGHEGSVASLDPISVADLLRNGFVYPPHSIYSNVKVATSGFDEKQDMYDNPKFHFPFQSSNASARPDSATADDRSLLQTYHRLLCESVVRCTGDMDSPWLLQSGGKDSTSLAIAVAEVRPQTTCMTYLGGPEENELESARLVARELGLRHETLTCDPGRAYDRYLAMVPRIPLLTADFALLSYVDLATEIRSRGGDGVIDGLGSDVYFGTPLSRKLWLLRLLARNLRLPSGVFGLGPVGRSFKLCYALGTLQMNSFERFFPGSRFTDVEVDALFGRPIAHFSRQRLETYRDDIDSAASGEAMRRVACTIDEASSAFAKGMYVARAASLRAAYPYCDARLRDWVFHHLPDDRLIGPGGVNKILVRRHIARRFHHLPYLTAKGSFRFDLCGLALRRFDQVHAFAVEAQALLPGAVSWLELHRGRLNNKYFASKFYLLAVILPWLLSHVSSAEMSGMDDAPSS
ncbi:asparagine synthase-related protein [Rhodanobacter umsongensis]|uniref:Asparagine synthase-related protein n=1 Tax=Rhodanobacter umsongensis TaxID=633153 RepID=A0ABW0JJY0_9GAMM